MDPDECQCPCHTNSRIAHFVACCDACPKCGKRIALGRRSRHAAACDAEAPPGPRPEYRPRSDWDG